MQLFDNKVIKIIKNILKSFLKCLFSLGFFVCLVAQDFFLAGKGLNFY